MHLAYIDESGDSGDKGSRTFTLGCILVEGRAWPDTFDQVIDYRRFLRDEFGLPVRAEIKANYLLRNSGPFRDLGLGEAARYRIYRGAFRLQPKLGTLAFAVVISKERMVEKGREEDPSAVAWEYMFQRLERFSTKNQTPLFIVHDEGDALRVRKLARKARRAGSAGSRFGTGTLRRPATLLLDDPASRSSDQSYFLQFADLVAYAAFRNVYPPPQRRTQIVPQVMWNELGEARYAQVNKFSGGTPGVVLGP